VCGADAVPCDGSGRYVIIRKRAYAVFRDGPNFVVMDDACPHAGASLSAGRAKEGCVLCPWHAWAFALQDGRCPDNPDIAVRTYPVRVEGGRVLAQL
jgi:nitrite reductase/ring-hydroxylating ferredoxin subunit